MTEGRIEGALLSDKGRVVNSSFSGTCAGGEVLHIERRKGRPSGDPGAGNAGSRWRVEEFLEDGKGYLGIADYEARSWTSWHHHMSLVALAHLCVTQTRRDLNREVSDLTLDMAMRLLRAALPRPQLTLEQAGELVDYYRDGNEQATNSHRKTWLATHS